MKLLLDQNLSRKLVSRLTDIFPDASHVQFHDLAAQTDTAIWEFARINSFCIVTQDADFAERSRLYSLSQATEVQRKWRSACHMTVSALELYLTRVENAIWIAA